MERKKNAFDTVANPALIQRRIAGPTWVAKAQPWQARRESSRAREGGRKGEREREREKDREIERDASPALIQRRIAGPT